ncbi:unnamed protein product [Zymoseptoria tritici ST99CH_3D7]|uniref:Uncharacterized protein n=1 Tax=Zymoseptoria tritici (strain ST99CH_3D7) TaxID=1276538 RepID=A0A1X7S9X4_ZYMT9|nr:unnamed protein product [Zymoseptoria tritici ST99CH_3D7]
MSVLTARDTLYVPTRHLYSSSFHRTQKAGCDQRTLSATSSEQNPPPRAPNRPKVALAHPSSPAQSKKRKILQHPNGRRGKEIKNATSIPYIAQATYCSNHPPSATRSGTFG